MYIPHNTNLEHMTSIGNITAKRLIYKLLGGCIMNVQFDTENFSRKDNSLVNYTRWYQHIIENILLVILNEKGV